MGNHDLESSCCSIDLSEEDRESGILPPRANVIKEFGKKFGSKIADRFGEAKNFLGDKI